MHPSCLASLIVRLWATLFALYNYQGAIGLCMIDISRKPSYFSLFLIASLDEFQEGKDQLPSWPLHTKLQFLRRKGAIAFTQPCLLCVYMCRNILAETLGIRPNSAEVFLWLDLLPYRSDFSERCISFPFAVYILHVARFTDERGPHNLFSPRR